MKMKLRKQAEYVDVEISDKDILDIISKTFDRVFDFNPEIEYIANGKVCYDDYNYHNPIAVESRKENPIDSQIWNIYTRIREKLNN